jgi:hypothetical protein
MTYYHEATGAYIAKHNPFTLLGVQYPSNWLENCTPEDIAAMGLTEVTTVGTREDDRYFWVGETLAGAVRTITNTPKDPAMVAEMKASGVQAHIDRLEREVQIPRPTREFMMLFMETNFPAEALANHFGYQKVKAFDAKIKAVREGTWVEPEVLP